MFQYTISEEKAEPRPIHDLSILSIFMLRKMWEMDNFQRGVRGDGERGYKCQHLDKNIVT